MLTEEKVSIMLDRNRRRLVSSLKPPDSRLIEKDHAPEWRRTHVDLHRYREAMICLTGCVSQSLNGLICRAEPGTLFFFESGEKHDSGYAPGTPDCAHMWMYIMPDVINCLGNELTDGELQVDFRYFYRNRETVIHLNRICDEATAGRLDADIAEFELKAIFDLIFADIVKNIAPGDQYYGRHGTKPRHQHESILAIMKYLDRTYGRDTDVVSLARLSGYSRPHFLRLFQEIAGCRVGEYINNRRTMRYYELQAQGASMKTIADELGFSSNASLCHWRKQKLS